MKRVASLQRQAKELLLELKKPNKSLKQESYRTAKLFFRMTCNFTSPELSLTHNVCSETGPGLMSSHQPMMYQALEDISMRIIICIILLVSLVGIPGNILTILVYVKLGFAETINISYVALAVTDLGVLLFSVAFAVVKTPSFSPTVFQDIGFQDLENYVVLVSRFLTSSARATGLITSWISLERCVCVLFPLKVKMIITRNVTKLINGLIISACLLPTVIHFLVFWVESEIRHTKNETEYDWFFEANKSSTYTNILYGVVYPCINYSSVVICTTLLVIKVLQSSRWRHSNVTATNERKGDNKEMSTKENRIVKTVIAITTSIILCSLPQILSVILLETIPGFSWIGYLRPLFVVVNAVGNVTIEINSSINIFVYAFLGTKFRETLKSMLEKTCFKSN